MKDAFGLCDSAKSWLSVGKSYLLQQKWMVAICDDHLLMQVVVFALGPGSCQEDLDKLVAVLSEVCHTSHASQKFEHPLSPSVEAQHGPPKLSPRAAFFAGKNL